MGQARCQLNSDEAISSAVHWQFGILIFPVFGRFSAKLGPKTPLERRGSSCSAGCTKNLPPRPILRPFRGNSEFGNHPLQRTAKAISQIQGFGSSSKHAEVGPQSFGIVVCWFGGTVPDILGMVWPSFRTESGSKSEIPGRILNWVGLMGGFWMLVLVVEHEIATKWHLNWSTR